MFEELAKRAKAPSIKSRPDQNGAEEHASILLESDAAATL
jgi:hypothetical protein